MEWRPCMTRNSTESSPPPRGTPPKAPLVGLFVREDLSKPENRANLLLTAATGIAPFWVKFAEAVGLPPECRVKPMIWSTGRPDLTAMDGEKALAVFENENSGENAVQKAAYERCIRKWSAPTRRPRAAPPSGSWSPQR